MRATGGLDLVLVVSTFASCLLRVRRQLSCPMAVAGTFIDLPLTVRLAIVANILSLASNALTDMMRLSQVLYALLLTWCDAVVLGSERPFSGRVMFAVQVVVLLSLWLLYSHRAMFWLGDVCGYVSGVVNILLAAVVVGTPASSLHVGQKGPRVAASYVAERLLAMLGSVCYLVMLWGEGGALYRGHTELIRWYGNVVSVIGSDALLLAKLWIAQPLLVKHESLLV